MRSPLPLGLAVVAATVAANAGRDGYLALVGPKPVVFSRPSVPLAVAIARLPALAKETPDPRSIYGSGTNDSVLLPPPGSSTNSPAKGTKSGAVPAEVHKGQVSGAIPGSDDPGTRASSPGTGDPVNQGHGETGTVPESIFPLGLPGIPGDSRGIGSQESGLPSMTLQMLLPYFRNPATTNRQGLLMVPVPFTPGQPPNQTFQPAPRPAASSTATYEQH